MQLPVKLSIRSLLSTVCRTPDHVLSVSHKGTHLTFTKHGEEETLLLNVHWRTLGLRGVEELTQRHKVRKWQHWDQNPGLADFKASISQSPPALTQMPLAFFTFKLHHLSLVQTPPCGILAERNQNRTYWRVRHESFVLMPVNLEHDRNFYLDVLSSLNVTVLWGSKKGHLLKSSY